MKKFALITTFIYTSFAAIAQDRMTPELLWKLGRVRGVDITRDSTGVVFTVSTPDVDANKSNKKTYLIPLSGGTAKEIADSNDYVRNDRLSPNGKFVISADDVKMRNVFGKDFYPDLTKSTAQIYDQLGLLEKYFI
ncbi:MAG: hypothetical protein WKG06_05345 [Segetibacter sp.]